MVLQRKRIYNFVIIPLIAESLPQNANVLQREQTIQPIEIIQKLSNIQSLVDWWDSIKYWVSDYFVR